jgi:hypothetical protein
VTICVAVRVNDGIVFAADSATTLSITKESGKTEVINVYKHGMKVFNLYKGRPLCAMTCGLGNFGARSISTLSKDFRHKLTHGASDWYLNKDDYSLEEVVTKAKNFFFDEVFSQLDPRPSGAFEYWIGGYPSDISSPFELWKFGIYDGVCEGPTMLSPPGAPGISWGGSPAPLSRLVLGFDHTLVEALDEAITFDGMGADTGPAGTLDNLMKFIRARTEVYLLSPAMPIQNAIELADFLVETAKRYYAFLPGADIVGGDTDIATVTRHEGFKWIRRKHYYSQTLNPLEDGHA